MIVLLQLLIHSKSYISGTRDVHGGAVAAGFGKNHRGSGAVAFFSSVAVRQRQRQLFNRDGNLCLELCSY
jgi:hypothetical protein